ncbi:probable adenylate kinase 7, mitochondrial [Actinidia eriantha]|uniref:probable adenylate kinase 7, mitochondrial n=1 Tax=Actinidia eriantha TaxID=165200 RepID=UPI00258E37EE|nr:probable adenylate kinase 7, mitochondrial [Actinidia eriantha]
MAALRRFRVAAQPELVRRGLGIVARREYAAAQIQYDYDDEEYESESWRNRNRSIEDSEGSVRGRGVQWVIMGDPLVKKRVYAERLAKLLQVPHISMGTLVRQEFHPHSSLYKQIANAVNQGKLVPEDIIFGLLSKRLEEGYYNGETGFILDGIPRTRIQAEILDEIAGIDLVVNFKCTEESLLKQHTRNGIYSPGQEYLCMGKSGINLNLPSQDNPILTGADAGGCWKEQLRAYAEQSKPLEDYYRKQRKLLDFQVTEAPGETWQGLLAALHLQHMNAATSQKLTA